MSIISLQFGQCGNQIGQALYSTIHEDISLNVKQKSSPGSYYWQCVNKWFDVTDKGKFEPRSVLIDTEDKVIQNNKTLNRNFTFRNVVAKRSGGSANNWAYGYCCQSKLLAGQVLELVRKEFEKSDYITSLLNLFSSSGGTGSGVGSYIIEKIRDEYPNKLISNAVVLPFIKGEIITQSYNSLLNLAHLYNISNSFIMFENEKLHYICKYSVNVSNIAYSNINTIISQQIASIFQPINNADNFSLLNDMTSHSSYKFLTLKTEPNIKNENKKFETTKQWSSLIQTLNKQSRFDLTSQQKSGDLNPKPKSICNTLITRGSSIPQEKDLKCFLNPKEYVTWLPPNESFKKFNQNNTFLDIDKHLTLISNSNVVCSNLNSVLDDAWSLFTHSAYLHHYKKYGVDEEAFLNAFQILENVLGSYKTM